MKVFPKILLVLAALFLARPASSAETLVAPFSEKGLSIHCENVPLEKVLEQIHTLMNLEIIVEEAAGRKNVTADIELETVLKAIESLLDKAEVNYAMSFDPKDKTSLTKLYVGAGDPDAPVTRMSASREEDDNEADQDDSVPPTASGKSPAPPLGDSPEMPPVDEDPYDTPAIDEDTPALMPPVGDPGVTPASPGTPNQPGPQMNPRNPMQANPATQQKKKKKNN